MQAKLPKVHKELSALIGKNKYSSTCNEIIKKIKQVTCTKIEFELLLQTLFAKIKDPHTMVMMNPIDIPVVFEYVNGSFYPFVIKTGFKEHLCKKLHAINNMPLSRFVEIAQKYLVFDNDEIKKIQISQACRNYDLIKLITKSGNKNVTYTFDDNTKIIIKKPERNELPEQTSIYRINGNEHLSTRQNYYNEDLDGILYARYCRCKEDNNYPYNRFIADIQKALKSRPAKIIVDMRNNEGGNSSLFDSVIEIFQRYNIEYKPQVYCLINRRVFSSGVLNTYDMKAKCGATLVGQPTGQGVNHFGEVKNFRLPYSKVIIQYSSRYFKRIEDPSSTIKPDILIEPTIEDYASGIDPVLGYCLKQDILK